METDFNERAKAFEKIVGKVIDRLNDNISDLERAKDNQNKDIELYDRQLRIKLEELREKNATVEEQEMKIKELERNPEICELDDKLLKMEKEKDSLKFEINLYHAQLKIEIEKRREIQLAIDMLQKERNDLVCNVKAKEESIKEITHEKDKVKDALVFLKEKKPFSHAEVIERTKAIKSRLSCKSEENKELKRHIFALKEEIKCLNKKNEETSNEAKQQMKILKDKTNAILHKQKEELDSQWQTEIDKAIKHEEDKRITVCQHRDEMIQMVQKLISSLKEKEHEATQYSNVCNQLKGNVENLGEKLLEKTKEVQTHFEAKFELAENIVILERKISVLSEEIECLEKKNEIISNEAKQQIENQAIKMNAILQKQQEDLDSHWKTEVDKAIKHEKDKQISVSQQRDDMMQTIQALSRAIEEKEYEATEYADSCNRLKGTMESLVQKIAILEAKIQDQKQDVTVLSSEQLGIGIDRASKHTEQAVVDNTFSYVLSEASDNKPFSPDLDHATRANQEEILDQHLSLEGSGVHLLRQGISFFNLICTFEMSACFTILLT